MSYLRIENQYLRYQGSAYSLAIHHYPDHGIAWVARMAARAQSILILFVYHNTSTPIRHLDTSTFHTPIVPYRLSHYV